MKKVLSILITIVLLCSFTLNAMAEEPKTSFADVPAGHWAEEAIQALTSGGLVKGYPNGNFGTADYLTVDQMATLICNIKGLQAGTKNGYWGYGAVEQCIKMGWLAKNGEITAANYGVPCTRELALDMFVKSCNIATGDTQTNPIVDGKEKEKIPDYDEISSQYKASVKDAYRWGVLKGIDDKGTFAPKKYFYRTELVTILFRTGYTTAAEVAVENTTVTGELTNYEAFEEIKSWGMWDYTTEDVWANDTKGLRHTLTTNDEKYGKVVVQYHEFSKCLFVTMYELVENQNEYLGITSRAVQEGISRPDMAKLFKTSSYADDGRALVSRIIGVVTPNSKSTVVDAVYGVMLSKLYEVNRDGKANAIRWLAEDNRGVRCMYNNGWYNNSLAITFYELGDVASYEDSIKLASGRGQDTNDFMATVFAPLDERTSADFNKVEFASEFYGFDDQW